MSGPERAAAPAGFPVVVLVASAGGLEALRIVLEALPARFEAAVVALLHQNPDRENELPKIIGRNTPLDVVAAQEGAPLAPGRIHITPPGSHVLVTHDVRVTLVASGPPPPSRPSADLLLASLALAVGPRAIAVVLTGGGHDGATGATAVHHLGGTVIATDEATSEVFSMPSATIARDHAVDHVVALGDVAGLLVALVDA